MALFDSPHLTMRDRIAESPQAFEPYAAFEETVRNQLIAWPGRSADLATALIMSIWARTAAKQGLINIPAKRLKRIVNSGRVCGRQLKPAEMAWANELMSHLMPVTAVR